MTATSQATRTPQAARTIADGPPSGAVLRPVVLSALLVTLGTALGFVRDLMMARYFGANGRTDAFLVGWTIPETVSPLLIEDAMALLMIPVFSRLIEEQGSVRGLVTRTLPRMSAVLAALAGLTAWGAPFLVGLLAPGLSTSGLAVQCVRLTSITVLTFGIAGFLSAGLRAHQTFGPAAALSAAYNVGILGVVVGLHTDLGILSAALGVACGSILMSAVQFPAFLRRADLSPRLREPSSSRAFAAVIPVVLYTLTRQAQVFVERFLGSSLAPGSISHLNYAQKVAQVPMILALVIVTVTFPLLARDSARGNDERVRRRVETDLATVGGVVILAAAYLVAFASPIIKILFEHGEFTAADTATTAAIMRVYALGLVGQAFVGVLGRAFFAAGRPRWYPVLAIVVGLVVNAGLGAFFVGRAGVLAIAGANAAGITISALLLLVALRCWVPVSIGRIARQVARMLPAGGIACWAGWLTAGALRDVFVPAVLAAGAVVVVAAYLLVLVITRSTFLVRPWS